MRIKPLLYILLILTLTFSSCGYGLHRQTRLESVSIGRIENKTLEHGLEDRLNVLLTEELMRNGIRVDPKAPERIEGSITKFELRGIAQKGDITIQYDVLIEASFSLIGPDGKPTPLRTDALFPITFSSEGSLEEITALKEEATERALKDMASEIAASVVFK